jgi:hypothetical protein
MITMFVLPHDSTALEMKKTAEMIHESNLPFEVTWDVNLIPFTGLRVPGLTGKHTFNPIVEALQAKIAREVFGVEI